MATHHAAMEAVRRSGYAPNFWDFFAFCLFFATLVMIAHGGHEAIVMQNGSLALTNASFAYVLEAGRIVLEGPADVLAQDKTIAARYLGGT